MVKGGAEVVKLCAPMLAKNSTKYFGNTRIRMLNKGFAQSEESGITHTKNEVKYTIKIIKSLANRDISWRITELSMRVGLLLMKNVSTPLAKIIVIISSNSIRFSNKYSYSKENIRIRHGCTDNLKRRNDICHGNS